MCGALFRVMTDLGTTDIASTTNNHTTSNQFTSAHIPYTLLFCLLLLMCCILLDGTYSRTHFHCVDLVGIEMATKLVHSLAFTNQNIWKEGILRVLNFNVLCVACYARCTCCCRDDWWMKSARQRHFWMTKDEKNFILACDRYHLQQICL